MGGDIVEALCVGGGCICIYNLGRGGVVLNR